MQNKLCIQEVESKLLNKALVFSKKTLKNQVLERGGWAFSSSTHLKGATHPDYHI